MIGFAMLVLSAVAHLGSQEHAFWQDEMVADEQIRQLAATVPEDSDAPSAVVLDRTVVVLFKDGKSYEVTQHAVKISKETGLNEGWESDYVSYNSFYSKVPFFEARTLLPDGEVVAVKQSDIRRSVVQEGRGSIRFDFPRVTVGAILYYAYVEEYEREVMPGHFAGSWRYWSGTPVVRSTLVIESPVETALRVRHVNGSPQESTELIDGGKRVRKTWQMERLEKLDKEHWMPPPDEMCPFTEYTTTAAWSDISKWYWGVTSPMMTLGNEAEQAMKVAVGDATEPLTKAEKIWDWVTKNLRYVSTALGDGTHKPVPPDETFKRQFGDCKDQSVFLAAALKKHGIQSQLALLAASQKRKFDDSLPNIHRFDHVVVVAKVDGQDYWLDPAAGQSLFGLVPESVRGVPVLLVDESGGSVVTAPKRNDFEPDSTRSVLSIELMEDGAANVMVRIQTPPGIRREIDDPKVEDSKKYFDQVFKTMLESLFPTVKGVVVEISDPDKLGQMGEVVVKGKASKVGTRIGDMLLLDVLTEEAEDTEIDMEDYVGKNGKRDHPFVFVADDPEEDEIEVRVPPGWEVVECLKPLELTRPGMRWTRTVTRDGEWIRIKSRTEYFEARLPASDLDKVLEAEEAWRKASEGKVVLRVPAGK